MRPTGRRSFLQSSAALLAGGIPARAASSPVIRKVEAFAVRMPYRDTFVIGRGTVATGGGAGQYCFVRLETDAGQAGWGETIALPSWSYETAESITGTVRQYLAPILTGHSPFDHAEISRRFDAVLTPAVSQGFPFAKAAAMTAVLDLAGQIAGVPLHRLFGGKLRDTVELSFALSIDTPERMAQAALAWPTVTCFKVKVAGDAAADAARVMAVAKARPDAMIWIDANQSYRPVHLEAFLKAIDGVAQVRCLEQPVTSPDWLGLKRAREKCRWPVAVDEGCFSAYDVARLARMEAADLVVLKVAKSGGPWNCYRSACVAEANGLGLLGSGLTESGVGLTATVHLFSTLDLLLPPELNGPKFLEELFVDDLAVKDNRVTVPDAPGLGVRVKEERLRSLALRI
jgi:muconate cycloisomerase